MTDERLPEKNKLYAWECIMGHRSSNGVVHCTFGEVRFTQGKDSYCLYATTPNYWKRCEILDLVIVEAK